MNNTPVILNLPLVPLLKLFDYFSDDTAVMRKILAPVCKKFYNLANDTSFLHKVQFYSHHNETCEKVDERFEQFCTFLLSLQEHDPSTNVLSNINTMAISVRLSPLIMSPVWSFVCQHLHRLQTLSISSTKLNDRFLTDLPSSLTHLHLLGVFVPDNFFQPLQDERVLPNLKCLHLIFRFFGHPQLQLSHLASRAPKLESLSMGSPRLSSSIFPVLRNATNLKSLSISGKLSSERLTSPLESIFEIITSSCRHLEHLKFQHLDLNPFSLILFYSLSRLTKLKQLSFNTDSCPVIKIEHIWSLCDHLGPYVKVKVYFWSSPCSRMRHRDWTARDIQFDNLNIVLSDPESLSVACIPPSSTQPTSELYGRKRPSISNLCCPCNDCKRESQSLKIKFPASSSPCFEPVPNKQKRINKIDEFSMIDYIVTKFFAILVFCVIGVLYHLYFSNTK